MLPIAPRTLRAANAGLYLACVVLVIFACVYVICTRHLSPAALAATVVCGALCSLWGIHYALLRFRISQEGITRIVFFASKTFTWQSLQSADLQQTDQNSIATCKITLRFADVCLVLSSELLSLDALQDLAADLRTAGFLPPLPPPALD